MHIDVVLSGPLACGKTYMAEKIAELIKKEAAGSPSYLIRTQLPGDAPQVEFYRDNDR